MFNYAWRRVVGKELVPVAFHSSYILDSMQFARTRRSQSVAHANSHAGAARDGSNRTSVLCHCGDHIYQSVRGRPTVARPIAMVFRVSLGFRRACSGAGSRLHQAFARPKRARPGTSRGSRVGEGRSTPPRRRGRSGPVMSRWGAAPARKSNLKSNRPPAREEDKTKEYMNPGRGPNGLLISTLGT